jgi:hypothetical protein
MGVLQLPVDLLLTQPAAPPVALENVDIAVALDLHAAF